MPQSYGGSVTDRETDRQTTCRSNIAPALHVRSIARQIYILRLQWTPTLTLTSARRSDSTTLREDEAAEEETDPGVVIATRNFACNDNFENYCWLLPR